MEKKNLFIKKNLVKIIIIVMYFTFIGLIEGRIIYLDLYLKRILNLCAIYAIVSLSMNLVNGFTGLFSLGQAGFMALGAYTVAILTVPIDKRAAIFYLEPMVPWLANLEIPLIFALILGGVIAAIFGILIGAPVLRLRGDYLAIATLGFSEIVRIILTNLQSITNGALGIKYIPTIDSMWWTAICLFIAIVFMSLLIKSTYGRAFKAIREDEIAAEAMGVNLFKHKLLSFSISAFISGIGGGLMAALLGTVDPKQFYFTLTYNILLMIVLGGMGSISGSVIGAFIVTAGLEWLRFLDEPLNLFGMNIPLFRPGLRMVIFALALMTIVLFYNKGIMGDKEISIKLIKSFVAKIKSLFTRKNTATGGGVH